MKKRIISLLTICIVMLLLAGAAYAATTSFTLSSTELSFEADGGFRTLTVGDVQPADTSFTIKTSASWLTYSSTPSGLYWNIEADENRGETRTATITVTGGGVSKTVNVTQSGVSFKLSSTSLNFEMDGGTQTFTVGNVQPSNLGFSATSNVSWLTIASTPSGQYWNATASENTSGESRTATITVTGGDVSRTIYVTQYGVSFTLSTNRMSFDADGGKLTFTISDVRPANASLKIYSYMDWLKVSSTASGTQWTVIADSNYGAERYVSIAIEGGGNTKYIDVSQTESDLCGENLTWSLENGVLTISGTGDMGDYDLGFDQRYAYLPHWYSKSNEISTVIIEDGVTNIGNDAFEYCERLTSVKIPDSVTSIGEFAFYGCSSLTSVVIPDSVTSIGRYAFGYCSSLASVVLPDSLTSIVREIFYSCRNLTSIVIPDSVTSIGFQAFDNCSSLTSIVIPDSVTSIGDDAFEFCSSLTSVVIPDSVKSISRYAFYKCNSLTSVEIPDSVTSIGDDAFEYCSSLTSVVIPDSVKSISRYAFYGCSALTDIYYSGTKEEWNAINIGNYAIPSTTKIHYNWNNASGKCGDNLEWKLENGVLTIRGHGDMWNSYSSISVPWYEYRENITSVALYDDDVGGITSIGDYAFSGCSNLKGITLPSGVYSTAYLERIGKYAFSGSGLTAITIPSSVKSIGASAFSGCSNLGSANISYNVSVIEDSTFSGCSSLTSIIIPSGATSIGNSAFYGCSSLKKVTIPDAVTSLGASAFYGCSSLTSVTMGSKVTTISNYAFKGCTALSDISFSDSIKSIGNNAFEDCTSLKNIRYTGTELDWKKVTLGTNAIPSNIRIIIAWDFKRDSYCFTNSDSYFGTGTTYYISNEDLKAFLNTLNNTEIRRVANSWAVKGTVTNLEANNLVTWTGSCYGMSLTAALFKEGILTTNDYGGNTTYKLPQVTSTTDTTLESLINVYQLSQCTNNSYNSLVMTFPGIDFALYDAYILQDFWEKAKSIGNPYSVGSPFLVRLERYFYEDIFPMYSEGSHAVVCFGAEEGNFSYDGTDYSMRLLIADPNCTNETYIYISNDFYHAVYTGNNDYDCFGYRDATLSELDPFSGTSLKTEAKRYSASATVNSATIMSTAGSITVIDKKIVAKEGNLNYNLYYTENGNDNPDYIILLTDDVDSYTVTPAEEGKPIDFTLYFDDYCADITIDAESVVIGKDGTIEVKGAKGDAVMELAINDSDFDFVDINGKADGDFRVEITSDTLEISGSISDYSVSNMELFGETSELIVDGDEDLIINNTSGNLAFTPAENTTYEYADNADGTHTATNTVTGDTVVESHIFENGFCKLCNAEDTHIEYPKGDLDMSGKATNSDVVLLARYLVQLIDLTPSQMLLADMNGDGNVTNNDIVILARILVGLQ